MFWKRSCFSLGWWGTFAFYKFLALWWGTSIILKMNVIYLKFLRWGFLIELCLYIFKQLGFVLLQIILWRLFTSLIWLTLFMTCSLTYTCHRIHWIPIWNNFTCLPHGAWPLVWDPWRHMIYGVGGLVIPSFKIIYYGKSKFDTLDLALVL